jgi:hypothetical protein
MLNATRRGQIMVADTKSDDTKCIRESNEESQFDQRSGQVHITDASTVLVNLDEIQCDLETRKQNNRARMRWEQELERRMLKLNVNWAEFHELLFQAFEEVVCEHDHTECRRILTGMGLDDELTEVCTSYLPLQGGGCDCEVVLNVDMTNPRPLVGFSCADCGDDYGEDYMVHDYIWQAFGVGDGMLCIGCLEKRIGRQLCAQDFTDAPVNDINDGIKSLRLKDRLTRCAPQEQDG